MLVFVHQISHKNCLQFLLRRLYVPRETENNVYAQFWRDNKKYYSILKQAYSRARVRGGGGGGGGGRGGGGGGGRGGGGGGGAGGGGAVEKERVTMLLNCTSLFCSQNKSISFFVHRISTGATDGQ